MVRRLKPARRALRVGVVIWTSTDKAIAAVKRSAAIGCDFLAHSMADAVVGALAAEPRPAAYPAPASTTSRS